MNKVSTASSAVRRPVLRPELRSPAVWAAGACSVLFVAIGLSVAGSSSAFPVDDRLAGLVGAISPSRGAALLVDACGEPYGAITLIVLIGGACLATGRWRLAALTVAAQGVIGATTNLVKPVFDRTIHGDFLSYPSGHTAGATAFALVLALLAVDLLHLRRPLAVATVAVATVGAGLVAAWAQTLLVAHYATDTIGGFGLSVLLVVALAFLIDGGTDRILARSAAR